MKKCFLVGCSMLMISFISFSQKTEPVKANYALASRFSPNKVNKMLFSTSVDPHWLKNSDRFWYVYETREGKFWYIVDAARRNKRTLFDNAKLAAELTRIVKDPFDAQHLPIQNLKFIKDENTISFEIRSTQDEVKKDTTAKADTSGAAGRRGGAATRGSGTAGSNTEKKVFYFEYNLLTGVLTELKDYEKPKARTSWASFSPDKKVVIYTKQHNLYWMDSANYRKAQLKEEDSTIVEHQLTKDGVEDYSYGFGGGEDNVEKEKNKNKRKRAFVMWSPNGKYFVVNRTDSRTVKDLWVINNVAEPRPTLESYKYQMPGEKEAPVREVYLFDYETKTSKKIKLGAFKDQEVSVWSKPPLQKERDDEDRASIWHGTDDKFYLTRTSRDLKRIDVCLVNVTGDSAISLIEERLNTYVESRRIGLVNGGKELIQWSEADGWAHFYLYDGNGKLKNQITSGSFHCENIESIDEKNRVLYFTANGREASVTDAKKGTAVSEDPYYLHLYRINFDGSGLQLLNPGNYDHAVSMDDNNRYFVNTYSRVNTAPVSVLMDNTGKQVLPLETTDMSGLLEAGYKFPEPFIVKADDGITDLYGVLYKPFDFDSTKKYPIITYVYPGPQTEAVNKAFGKSMDRIDRLAQLGFIVVTVGNRGGHPSRSKWYHNYGYGNLRDYGLADKKAAIEQLSYRHSFIDVDKVGIHGHSGGGFMSTAAMLVYPDFFKVAVSSAGNHENNIYNRWWSEKHHGVLEKVDAKGDTSFVYSIEKNPSLAKNLKGHLMLSTGDMDNNVHPANTIRMANALIKANKRFELVMLPGQRHGFGPMTEYFFWRSCDFFAAHLLGDAERPVDITEINKEIEQKR